jgi:hypothetical protein
MGAVAEAGTQARDAARCVDVAWRVWLASSSNLKS